LLALLNNTSIIVQPLSKAMQIRSCF